MIIDQVITRPKRENKEGESRSDAPLRSLVKAISWRAVGTLDTILLSWLISGSWNIAFSIGSLELLTKTIIYYLHERVWNKISWGKNEGN